MFVVNLFSVEKYMLNSYLDKYLKISLNATNLIYHYLRLSTAGEADVICSSHQHQPQIMTVTHLARRLSSFDIRSVTPETDIHKTRSCLLRDIKGL